MAPERGLSRDDLQRQSSAQIRDRLHMMTRPRFNPYLLLVLASLFWAGNMVMGRGLRDDLPPVALAFWRWVVAFACVLPLALPHLKAQ